MDRILCLDQMSTDIQIYTTDCTYEKSISAL